MFSRDTTPVEVMALYHSKNRILEMISYHLDHHKPVYFSEEKNFLYDWGIREAYHEVKTHNDAPLKVLDRLLVKYDGWAHTESRTADDFRIVAAAIDDIIDIIASS